MHLLAFIKPGYFHFFTHRVWLWNVHLQKRRVLVTPGPDHLHPVRHALLPETDHLGNCQRYSASPLVYNRILLAGKSTNYGLSQLCQSIRVVQQFDTWCISQTLFLLVKKISENRLCFIFYGQLDFFLVLEACRVVNVAHGVQVYIMFSCCSFQHFKFLWSDLAKVPLFWEQVKVVHSKGLGSRASCH